MDIVPRDEFSVLLSEEAARARAVAKPIKGKHKLLTAADETFDLIGGVPRFAMWADKNLGEFYRLYSKTIPQNVDISGDITIRPALPPSPLDEAPPPIEGEAVEVK